MIDNIDYLNEWNKPEDDHFTEIEQGRPQWWKMWPEKYATALDIENIDKDLTAKEKQKLFEEVGKAFINSMFYFLQHEQAKYSAYEPGSRDGRILWNALKRDIDNSYKDYQLRVEHGKRGGRPKNT